MARNYTIVDDVPGMVRLMDTIIAEVPSSGLNKEPALYLDAEGTNLSRYGELSILEMHVSTFRYSHTYLIHVHILQDLAFSTKDSNDHQDLKSILQDSDIAKVFFDVRMDSDALYGQFGIRLAGVIDLQLMEVASRDGRSPTLKGLMDCLRNDAGLRREERVQVERAKGMGKMLWNPTDGGSFERFKDKSLTQGIVDYCVTDCEHMPRLYWHYNQMLGGKVRLTAGDGDHETGERGHAYWAWKIILESESRAERAVKPKFKGGSNFNVWSNEKDY